MRPSLKAVVLTAAAALLAAGCSTSSTSSSAPSSDAPGQAGGTSAATGTPIEIGSILPTNAPYFSVPDWVAAEDAAAATINSQGGISGQRLSLVYCNENNNANDAVACARKFASDKNMVATVNDLTVAANTSLTQLLGSAGFANVNYLPLTTDEFAAPTNYPFDGQASWEYAAVTGAAIKRYPTKKVALVIPGNPSTIPGAIRNAIKLAGATIATTVTLPLTPITSYSSYAEQVVKSGADLAIIPLPDTEILGLIPAVRQLGGTNIRFAFAASSVSDAQLQQIGPGANGSVVFSPTPWVHDTADYPAVSQFVTSMQAEEARGDSAANPDKATPSTLSNWLAVYAVADVLKQLAASKTPITRASFATAFAAAKNLDMLGITKNWSPSVKQTAVAGYANVSNTYGYLMTVTNDQQVLLQKDPIDTTQYMK